MVRTDLSPAFDRLAEWALGLHDEIRNPARFRTRSNSELAADDAVMGGALSSEVVQLQLQTAADNLVAAVTLFADHRTPLSIATVARGALETASAAEWLLEPADREERIARMVLFKLQDSHDEFTFSGTAGDKEHADQRRRLVALGEGTGNVRSRFSDRSQAYSPTRVIRALQSRIGGELLRVWSLISGLAHGRRWALRVASSTTTMFTTERGTQVLKLGLNPILMQGTILDAGRVLSAGVALWNERSGNTAETALTTIDLHGAD